jgi:hypothetical protein
MHKANMRCQLVRLKINSKNSIFLKYNNCHFLYGLCSKVAQRNGNKTDFFF